MIDSTNPRCMADNIRHLSGEAGSQAVDISTLQTNVTTLQGKVAALEAYTVYVSDEVKIGKVGDDDLYRKIVTAETLTGGTSTDVLISADFGKLINIHGRVVSTNYQIPIPYPASSGNLVITASMYQTSLRITVGSYYTDTNALSDIWIAVEYTKSAAPSPDLAPAPDDTRSIEPEPEVREEDPEAEPVIDEPTEEPVVEVKKTTRKKTTTTE